jgi:hypothetical protein
VSCLIRQEWKGVFTFLPLLIFWNAGREKIVGETWIRFFKSGRNVNKPNGRRGFMLLWLYTKLNYNSIHVYIEYYYIREQTEWKTWLYVIMTVYEAVLPQCPCIEYYYMCRSTIQFDPVYTNNTHQYYSKHDEF